MSIAKTSTKKWRIFNMNLSQENIEILRAYAVATDTTDRYVILKEDGRERYITYAFKEGYPHDNRCLSWYDKLQPNALVRNGHSAANWKLHEVGGLYFLHEMNCGNSEKEGDEHCSAGHPCVKCLKNGHWSYKEPVKCACWLLEPVDEEYIRNRKLTVDQAMKFTEIYCNTQKTR